MEMPILALESLCLSFHIELFLLVHPAVCGSWLSTADLLEAVELK
jgi:hypothetical protein